MIGLDAWDPESGVSQRDVWSQPPPRLALAEAALVPAWDPAASPGVAVVNSKVNLNDCGSTASTIIKVHPFALLPFDLEHVD
jgi:hypothetical protein